MVTLQVADLMRTRFEQIQGDVPLRRFIDDKLLRSDQVCWPVLEADRPVGLISIESIRAKVSEDASRLSVADAMDELGDAVRPDLRGRDALKFLLASKRDPIPVVEAGYVVGLLHHADLMRWLALHQLENQLRI